MAHLLGQKENFLQKARAEREEAQKRLDELKATSQDATKLQKEIEVERSQRSDLQVSIPMSLQNARGPSTTLQGA